MNVKERAKYAWGRIVDLFRPRKPEIEVEIEEVTEEDVEEIDVGSRSAPVSECFEGEEPVPSRMTDEYKAWLAEQLEADDDSRQGDN